MSINDPELKKQVILVVEDDHSFRGLIVHNLERKGYSVRDAENGWVAQTIFDLEPEKFALIISDIKMPQMDGVALLKHVRGKSNVPFIVMTGFSEIIESKNAIEMGANAFLPKPVKTQALMDQVVRCLKGIEENGQAPLTPEQEANRYCRVSVNEFTSTTKLPSDIYLKINGKYLMVAHKGDAVPIERLKKFQANNVEYLYVLSHDFQQYIQLNLKISSALKKTSNISPEKKLRLLKHSAEAITQLCFVDKVDATMFRSANDVISDALKVVGEDPDLLDLLDAFRGSGDKAYSHAVSVAMLSNLICRDMGYSSVSTQYKVTLGALMHDIGKKELPHELLTKKRVLMTADEIKLLESHCTRGRDILMQFPLIPEDVAEIALHHHEKLNGTGFPQNLTSEYIHPLAKVIHVADLFTNLVMPMANGVEPMGVEAALERLDKAYVGEIDARSVQALFQVFKVAQPAEDKTAHSA